MLWDFHEVDISKYQPLFQGLSQNKSIRHIDINESDICEELSEVFIGESSEWLGFSECNITVDVFAAVSKRENTLLGLDLHHCEFKLDNDISSTKRAELESSNRRLNVEKLTFFCTRLGRQGYDAISRSLLDSNVTLKTISITKCLHEELDDLFIDGLKRCKSLETLEFRKGTVQNITLLASALPDFTLRELNLSKSYINSNAARALSRGISQNETLEILTLHCLHTSEDAWKLMMPCVGATSSLKILDLGQYDGLGDRREVNDHDYITDAGMLSLADALLHNSSLEELWLSCSWFVTSNGWTALSRALSHSVLKRLILYNCSIDDDAITAFANGLHSNGTLEVLNLANCVSVTTTGLLAFAHLLGSPYSGLTELDLSNIDIDDNVIFAFINELSGNENSKLKCLNICWRAATLSAFIWGPIKNLLCNTSSIDSAWSSNHKLCRLNHFEIEESGHNGETRDGDDLKIPREIYDLLQLNEDEDKKLVARKKLIKYHYSQDFDVNALIGSDQKLLPRKISWFGRDSRGLSPVYSIIRTLPDLCQNE